LNEKVLNEAIVLEAQAHLSRVHFGFAELIARHGPCTIRPKRKDYFDTLASSIISQQLSEKAATTIKSRICEVVGKRRPFRPVDFLEIPLEELRGAGLSLAKARFIKNLAHLVDAGTISFRGINRFDDQVIADTLISIPGIGPWTAQMFLIFAMARPDICAPADAGLRRAAKIMYGLSHPVTAKHFIRLSRPWQPYRSVASWYLWRMLD
jgi:DNA-3-methyladenine glycosylase II